MEESLLSIRNVGEYAYCPRLFYYMQVEGVFVPSVDTEKGIAVHKRVDQPSVAPPEPGSDVPDADRPRSVRSLTLSSETLGCVAVLDLAEIEGRVAVPVEYRKGRPRRLSADPVSTDAKQSENTTEEAESMVPWPTDLVQVGLQVLLLEEAGYEVPRAVLYYAEEKRRLTIPVGDELRNEARRVLEEAKQCAATGIRPLPLIEDPKCPRCSLQPICLPDEIHLMREQEQAASGIRRKLWPPRDDGIHVVAQQDGIRVGVNGGELRFTGKDGNLVRAMPLVNVESLSVLGSVQVSTQAVRALADRNIPVTFLSPAGRLIAMIDPMDSVSAEVRRAQVRKLDDCRARLELTRALITAKINNQRTLLMRNHERLPGSVTDELARLVKSAAQATEIESVRGYEGQAASLYFAHFSGMLNEPFSTMFNTHGRKRRPPTDPVNACLSFAYTMLTHECVAALRSARLEPAIGGFHVSRPGRPALALDLMEPFRPLIADSITVTCFNRGELTEGHFIRTAAGCAFTDAGRTAFFNAYARRMDTEITHPVFGYKLSYRRMIVLHARMIAAWLVGDIDSLAFLTTR